ncbi:Protein of unknown function [Pyronema omphalodes CBS 100304]|uniref:Uncharacterized protein n=1 Tax=Pyronema omphalodes (strain CBS 100304) TaxID=1076935 RepID=U4L2Y9_PYROM|nr:Protein of unknown function [Pyronema omphalodes CBS 100304]
MKVSSLCGEIIDALCSLSQGKGFAYVKNCTENGPRFTQALRHHRHITQSLVLALHDLCVPSSLVTMVSSIASSDLHHGKVRAPKWLAAIT